MHGKCYTTEKAIKDVEGITTWRIFIGNLVLEDVGGKGVLISRLPGPAVC